MIPPVFAGVHTAGPVREESNGNFVLPLTFDNEGDPSLRQFLALQQTRTQDWSKLAVDQSLPVVLEFNPTQPKPLIFRSDTRRLTIKLNGPEGKGRYAQAKAIRFQPISVDNFKLAGRFLAEWAGSAGDDELVGLIQNGFMRAIEEVNSRRAKPNPEQLVRAQEGHKRKVTSHAWMLRNNPDYREMNEMKNDVRKNGLKILA